MSQRGAFRRNCVIRSLRSISSSAALLGDMSMQLLSRREIQPIMHEGVPVRDQPLIFQIAVCMFFEWCHFSPSLIQACYLHTVNTSPGRDITID